MIETGGPILYKGDMSKSPVFPLIFCLFLIPACTALQDDWAPTVDTGNDKQFALLRSDLTACKQAAERAGEDAWTFHTRSALVTEDGTVIDGSVYRLSYSSCLKERHHPVIN